MKPQSKWMSLNDDVSKNANFQKYFMKLSSIDMEANSICEINFQN